MPSPGDLPNPGIEPRSPALQADSLWAEPQGNLVGGGDILFICHLDYQTVERKVCVSSFFDLPVGLTQNYSQILIS